MTREEINEFSGVEPYCFETDREEDWYKIGCIDGLDAADADPDTSSLWHDANEEPQQSRLILGIEGDDAAIYKWIGQDQNGWSSFIKDMCLSKWAYVDDLLPKGGKL